MEGQEAIPVPESDAPKAAGHTCEWCEETAHHAVQMVNGKGMSVGRYIYACDEHRELAETNKRIRSSGR